MSDIQPSLSWRVGWPGLGRSPTNSGSRGRGYVSRPHRVHRRHRAERHRRRQGARAARRSISWKPPFRTCIAPSRRARSPAAGWSRPISIGREPITAPAIRSSPRRTSPRFLPNYAEYKAAVEATLSRPDSDPAKTPPIEFGRMEPTASDPSVQQQFGMTVGIPNAGQVRALGMINIRGERSVTCKGDFDKHPSAGPLPAGAPAVCEEFRRQPDALERADELDRQYGRNPDLAAMPMYCIPFSFKDPYDTKDMRSTGGADAHYDIDFPARDHTLVAQLRAQGRDHLRQGQHHGVQRPRPRQSGRREFSDQDLAFDARLSAQHLGRQSLQFVRHDARRLDRLELGLRRLGQHQPGDVQPVRGDRAVMPRPGQPQFGGADPAAQGAPVVPRRRHRGRDLQRSRRHSLPRHRGLRRACSTRSRTPSTATTTRATSSPPCRARACPAQPYTQAITSGSAGALKGMRIGIIREFMVKHAKVDEPIVDAAAAEMKAMLGRSSRRHAGRIGHARMGRRSATSRT